MHADQHIWRGWVKSIHRWGLQEWVATFLEAVGPLTIIGAQMVYLGQPLLGRVMPDGHLEIVAKLLEEPSRTKQFIEMLREESS